MRQIILFILILFNIHRLFAQTDCKVFESYKDSQNWVSETNSSLPLEKKRKIINRIYCEQQITDQIKFHLTYVIDGHVISSFSKERIEIFEYVDSEDILLTESLCESDVYPQKCNLGFLIIDGLDKPIISNIPNVKVTEIKRKKKKIVIVLKSYVPTQVDVRSEDFQYDANVNSFKGIKLKKGKNRVSIPVENNLKLIEIIGLPGKIVIIK